MNDEMRWADVQCLNGDTFRVKIERGQIVGLDEALQEHLRECRWLNVDVIAENMFELHPPGTMIGFDNEILEVGEDGLWRNQYGQIPAGQHVVVEPQRHCKGCRCDEPIIGGGGRRMQHGG